MMRLDDLLETLQKAKDDGMSGDTPIVSTLGRLIGATTSEKEIRLDILDTSWVGPADPYFE